MEPKESRFVESHTLVTTVLIIVCLVQLFLNILVVHVVAEEKKLKNSGYFGIKLHEYPFICNDLSLSPDEDDVTFNVKKFLFKTSLFKNRYVCSYGNLTEGLIKFVERKARLTFASRQDSQNYQQCGNETLKEASGHLSASFIKVSRHQAYERQGSDSVIHWDKHPKNSFISEGLDYNNGAIRIPEGRFYFLYASLLINISSAVLQFQREVTSRCRFLLKICVNTQRGYERTLLHKYQDYNQAGVNAVSSLAVGGHVNIDKGEAVYVKASEASRIIRESVGNTFGIMPL